MGINCYPSAEIIELYLGLSLGYVSQESASGFPT